MSSMYNRVTFQHLFSGSCKIKSKTRKNKKYFYLRSCDCPPEGKCEAADGYLNQFDETFKYSLPKGGKVAGFFAESIQVCTLCVKLHMTL